MQHSTAFRAAVLHVGFFFDTHFSPFKTEAWLNIPLEYSFVQGHYLISCFLRGTLTVLFFAYIGNWANAAMLSYTYPPRSAGRLDTNSLNSGVAYTHEPASLLNCSYVRLAGNAPSIGSITYGFQATPGEFIHNIVVSQLGVLYTAGSIVGEYSTNNGASFRGFFSTDSFSSPVTATSTRVNLRSLNSSSVLIRYTMTLTSGANNKVQFCRDCDDTPASLRFDFDVPVTILSLPYDGPVSHTEPPPTTDTNQCFTADSTLVHWWPGDTAPVDFVTGTSAVPKGGLSYANATVRSGFSFDGLDDYLQLGEQAIPVPWTALMWINRKDSVDSSAVLLSSTVSALKAEQVVSGRKVGITRYGVADWSFNYSLPRDHWMHLAFVAVRGATRLYVNGSLEDIISPTIPLPLSQLGLRLINPPLAPGAFKGIIDELMIYDDSLTGEQVKMIYSAGAHGVCQRSHLLVRSSAANDAFSFSVIAPVGDRVTLFQSTDLKNWFEFLSTDASSGVLDFRFPQNSPMTVYRVGTAQ